MWNAAMIKGAFTEGLSLGEKGKRERLRQLTYSLKMSFSAGNNRNTASWLACLIVGTCVMICIGRHHHRFTLWKRTFLPVATPIVV